MAKRALLSVSDKSGLKEFAQGLVDLGWEIIATGGTQKLLIDNKIPNIGISEVTDSFTIVVSEETGGVAIAENGELTRRVGREFLYDRLIELQNKTEDTEETGKGFFGKAASFAKHSVKVGRKADK